MRSLRPDPLFDDIIKTIFPRREIMEGRHAALLSKLSKDGSRKGSKAAISPLTSPPPGTFDTLKKSDTECVNDGDIMSFELQPYMEKMPEPSDRDLTKALCRRLVRVMCTATGKPAST